MKEKFNPYNPQTQILMKNIDASIEAKAKIVLKHPLNTAIVQENKIFISFANNPCMYYSDIALQFKQLFDEDIDTDKIESALFKHYLRNKNARKELSDWVNTAVRLFIAAFQGSNEAITKLQSHIKTDGTSKSEHPERYRVFIFKLCQQYPEFNYFNNKEALLLLGNKLMKYLIEEILQYIADNNVMLQLIHNQQQNNTSATDFEIATYKQKIKSLEEAALRSTLMLNDLQEEFDEELQNVKQQELTAFFSQLNSEKYGRILDQLLVANSGFNKLTKEKYIFPVELNGIRIMVKRLIQFTKDCHINPIMKPNTCLQVSAKDIEFCEYMGTPFNDENEQKQVKVISSGWLYQDKDVQISRPVLKEVTENDEY